MIKESVGIICNYARCIGADGSEIYAPRLARKTELIHA